MMLEQLDFKLATAEKSNVYTAPCVRITLITPRMARFEYAVDNVFEDRETLAVMNRNLGKVKSTRSQEDGWNVIDTGKMRIFHKPDGAKLSSGNLRVEFTSPGVSGSWTPGQDDSGNLLGTTRTLDRCDGDIYCLRNKVTYEIKRSKLKLGKGFISRDGWSLIDDSSNVVVSLVDGKKWVAPREEKELQDLYLLAYGHDYRKAIADAAEVFGSQPLPPRYVLGYWYCRYWAYSDQEIEEVIDGLDRSETPIDVMVVDMDWHLDGWTGYTWDRRYFPDPDGFLKEMRRRNIRVSLNLHPADGVGKHEEQFEEFAKAMKLDPKKIDRIPFDITSPEYMKHYFEILHHPDERRGVDFWWMDWQQGVTTAMRGLDTLPWINHLHWEDMQKRGLRPLIFSRFGGIGAGRYAIGFSGDTYSNWRSLAYQPYFTATSSNVLYGYWSHDIGGHMPGDVEPELYMRWVQYGVYTPILRTHTTKHFPADRRFTAFAEPFSTLMSDAVRQRYELVPYIYSEDRRMFEDGVSLVYPLYYDYPEDQKAYDSKHEFFFGSRMLIAPVVSPAEKELAKVKVYLPEGEWYDTVRSRLLTGPCEFTDRYLYNEIPVFVRAGSIIPGQRDTKRLNEKSYSKLVANVYPGASDTYDLYEDDGISADYVNGNHAYIRMSHSKKNGVRTVTVKKLSGDFDGFLAKREVEFRLHGVVPPESVRLNGVDVPFCRRFENVEAGSAWCYDGVKTVLKVRVPEADVVAGVTLEVKYQVADEFAPMSNMRGNINRLVRVARVSNALQTAGHAAFMAPCEERLAQELAHTGVRLSIRPETWQAELDNLQRKLPKLSRNLKVLYEHKRGRYSAADNSWKFVQYPIATAMLRGVKR